MAAILSAAFIIASGSVKSVGKWLMLEFGTTEFWMPSLTAMLFIIPLFVFILVLRKTPPPTQADIRLRHARKPMSSTDRRIMFIALAPGLVALIILYMTITAFRDFRDNFAIEVWEELGVKDRAGIFTVSEIPVMLTLLIVFALFFLIRNNYTAFQRLNWIILTGLTGIMGTNLLFQTRIIDSPLLWTILTGTCLYLAYFPFNSMLFERMMALYPGNGNAGFLIYLADAFGYLGSILFLLARAFTTDQPAYFPFFIKLGYLLGIIGIGCILFSRYYFKKKLTPHADGALI
jgi:hypothetical protein